MISIKNQVYCTIKVKDVEVTTTNAFLGAMIFEGGVNTCATFMLFLQDTHSKFTSEQLFLEGSEVEVLLAKSNMDSNSKRRKFRVVTPISTAHAHGPKVQLNCIIDAPKFTAQANRQGIKGSSDKVLKTLAEDCGLTFSGPSDFNGKSMNDEQAWLMIAETRIRSAGLVCKHAWADAQSCMNFRVTADGELRYRNLTDVINTPPDKINYVFLHNAMDADNDKSKKVILVREAKDNSSAGLASTMMNYGSTKVEKKLSGDVSSYEKLEVETPGAYLNINDKVAKEVDRSRFEYSPIDCGNTHPKYEEAEYQNKKLNALFTERLFVLVDEVSNVQIFDPVIYRQADADLKKQVKNSDVYVVMSKVTVITGGSHYCEKLELARMSLTMGDEDMKTPQTFGSEKTMLPDVKVDTSASGAKSTLQDAIKLEAVNQQVVNSTTMLKSQQSTVASITSEGRTLFGDANASIQQSANNWRDTLQSLTQPIREISQKVDQLEGNYTSMATSAKALYDTYRELKSNPSEALRGAVLSAAGGALSGTVESISQAMQLQSINLGFQDLKTLAPSSVRNTVIFKEYSEAVDELDSKTTGVFNNSASTWNYNVATLKNETYQETGKYNDSAYKVSLLMSNATTTSSQAEAFVANEWVKETLGEPAYISSKSLARRTSEFTSLNADFKEMGRQVARAEGWE